MACQTDWTLQDWQAAMIWNGRDNHFVQDLPVPMSASMQILPPAPASDFSLLEPYAEDTMMPDQQLNHAYQDEYDKIELEYRTRCLPDEFKTVQGKPFDASKFFEEAIGGLNDPIYSHQHPCQSITIPESDGAAPSDYYDQIDYHEGNESLNTTLSQLNQREIAPPTRSRRPSASITSSQPLLPLEDFLCAQSQAESTTREQYQVAIPWLNDTNLTYKPIHSESLSKPKKISRFRTVLYCPTSISLDLSTSPLIYINRHQSYTLTVQDVLPPDSHPRPKQHSRHPTGINMNEEDNGNRDEETYKTIVKLNFSEDQIKQIKGNPAFWSQAKLSQSLAMDAATNTSDPSSGSDSISGPGVASQTTQNGGRNGEHRKNGFGESLGDDAGFMTILEYDSASASGSTSAANSSSNSKANINARSNSAHDHGSLRPRTIDTSKTDRAGVQGTIKGRVTSILTSQSFDQFEISWTTSNSCSSSSSTTTHSTDSPSHHSSDLSSSKSSLPSSSSEDGSGRSKTSPRIGIMEVSIPLRMHFLSTCFSPIRGVKGVAVGLSVTTSIVPPSELPNPSPESFPSMGSVKRPRLNSSLSRPSLCTTVSNSQHIEIPKTQESTVKDQDRDRDRDRDRGKQVEPGYAETNWSNVRVFRERGAERKLGIDILRIKKAILKIRTPSISRIPGSPDPSFSAPPIPLSDASPCSLLPSGLYRTQSPAHHPQKTTEAVKCPNEFDGSIDSAQWDEAIHSTEPGSSPKKEKAGAVIKTGTGGHVRGERLGDRVLVAHLEALLQTVYPFTVFTVSSKKQS